MLTKYNLTNGALRFILATALAFSFPIPAFAQNPAAPEDKKTPETTEEITDNNATEAESNPEAQQKAPEPLGPPTHHVFNEQDRNLLLRSELKYHIGSAELMTMTGKLENIVGIWQEDLSGSPVGGAIILTPADFSPSSAEIQNLQYYLALNGWSSLTIPTLPKDPSSPPPPSAIQQYVAKTKVKDETNENSEDTAPNGNTAEIDESEVVYQEPEEPQKSDGSFDEAPKSDDAEKSASSIQVTPMPSNKERMIERVELGFDALNNKNYFNNVLIAYNSSAHYFAESISSSASENAVPNGLRALVLVNPTTNYQNTTEPFDIITALNLPTLDIISGSHTTIIKEQTGRKNRAKQLKHPTYITQKVNIGEINVDSENSLSKAIRGFITRHASGTEVKQ